MKKLLALCSLLLISCQTGNFESTENEITVDTIIMESDFTPPSGPERGWGNDGSYEHRLLTAVSEDGIHWERSNQIVTEQGNTPDMVLNDLGQIMLYYTGSNIGEQDQAIAVAISNNADDWIFKFVEIDGEPEGISPGGDPDIVKLDEGHYRLYYTAHLPANSSPSIQFADSEDGIHFEYGGESFLEEDYQIMDSNTYFDGNEWTMITLTGFSNELAKASSSDGLHFEYQGNFSLGAGFLSNTILDHTNELLTYGFDLQSGLQRYRLNIDNEWELTEEMNFPLDKSTGLEAEYLKDPAVVQLNDGSYLMVYVTRVPEEGLDTVDNTEEDYFLMTKVNCTDESCWDCSKTLYSKDTPVDLGAELSCNTSLWDSLSPDYRRYSYFDGLTLKVFDYATQSSEEMMTLLDTVEGATVFWSPSGYRLALVAMNWDYEDLTKVFILDLDHKGRLVDKSTHLLKVRYSCHDAGCNVLDGYFWFEDEDTLRYQSWEGDPYDEENVSLETYDL